MNARNAAFSTMTLEEIIEGNRKVMAPFERALEAKTAALELAEEHLALVVSRGAQARLVLKELSEQRTRLVIAAALGEPSAVSELRKVNTLRISAEMAVEDLELAFSVASSIRDRAFDEKMAARQDVWTMSQTNPTE